MKQGSEFRFVGLHGRDQAQTLRSAVFHDFVLGNGVLPCFKLVLHLQQPIIRERSVCLNQELKSLGVWLYGSKCRLYIAEKVNA